MEALLTASDAVGEWLMEVIGIRIYDLHSIQLTKSVDDVVGILLRDLDVVKGHLHRSENRHGFE